MKMVVGMRGSCGAVIFALMVLCSRGELDCGQHGTVHGDHCDCQAGYVAASSAGGTGKTCVEDASGGVRSANAEHEYLALSLKDISGVWYGAGDQIHQSGWDVWTGDDEDAWPNCTSYSGNNKWNYEHFSPADPQATSIVDVNGTALVTWFGHQGAWLDVWVRYEENVAHGHEFGDWHDFAGGDDAEHYCYHIAPYVDLRTGELKATSIWKYTWQLNADGAVESVDGGCDIKGDETVGCFDTGSLQAGNREVSVVGRSTWLCVSGPCLAHAPLYNPNEKEDGQ